MHSEQRLVTRVILASVIATVLILGLNNSFQFSSNTYAQSEPLKVALLTDALFSDAGWGATAFNASQALKEKYGLELTTVENIAIPDIEPTLRDFADAGNNLIIAHGFEWGDPALRVGADYPDTKFVVFTGLTNGSNVASVFPMQQEGSYRPWSIGGHDVKDWHDWLCRRSGIS